MGGILFARDIIVNLFKQVRYFFITKHMYKRLAATNIRRDVAYDPYPVKVF